MAAQIKPEKWDCSKSDLFISIELNRNHIVNPFLFNEGNSNFS